MRKYFEAIWNHEFRKLPIDMVLFRVLLDPFEGPHERELGWQRVTGGKIAVEGLAGTHERVLTPDGSRELASRLEMYLQHRVELKAGAAAALANGPAEEGGAPVLQ